MYGENSHRLKCKQMGVALCQQNFIYKIGGQLDLACGSHFGGPWSTCRGDILLKIAFWVSWFKNMILSTMNECSSFEFSFLPNSKPLLWDFLLTLTLVKYPTSWLCGEWQLSWNGWIWRQESAWRWYFPNLGNLGKCQEVGMRIWNKNAQGWQQLFFCLFICFFFKDKEERKD